MLSMNPLDNTNKQSLDYHLLFPKYRLIYSSSYLLSLLTLFELSFLTYPKFKISIPTKQTHLSFTCIACAIFLYMDKKCNH